MAQKATTRKITLPPGLGAALPAAPETVSSDRTPADRLSAWKARWGISRMAYRVKPGLYALGAPGADSPVFATANYRLSFDALRTNLKGLSAWILALDTKGINVWCAAGKGTFGTLELARIIAETGLEKLVTHRRLILPQLGAPGVSAHRVKAYTGFSVAYGPVRAEDIPEYLRLGRATPEMRRVRFNFSDRMMLAPVQLVHFGRYLLPAAALLYLLGYRADAAYTAGALFAGGALVPALLPWLPGRSFAVKSAAAGLLITALIALAHDQTPAQLTARALIYTAAASFVGLDFTGASTYTSLSGVKKEMRLAMPAHALAFAAGLAILAAGRFL
ncbi:MAG: CO dehydrogenase/acetyl-CoA synthase subunit gamma-like protein [Elusimicrobia bacterium]|nr:MAG: CO dehydrogenase/acetyl-CoA synthase subunit gamma-like protein [Elusimicrobiota bacterium]KAF0153871.1 MAG: CO dehydrogenase/acetyl-CoA synthase subunit gamma-like protein [Elusimicrobiota bacterium]